MTPLKLSDDLRDAIDGGDECRGRDSQLTGWIEAAEALERKCERFKGEPTLRRELQWLRGLVAEREGHGGDIPIWLALEWIDAALAKAGQT